jgi:hypothetical protein
MAGLTGLGLLPGAGALAIPSAVRNRNRDLMHVGQEPQVKDLWILV